MERNFFHSICTDLFVGDRYHTMLDFVFFWIHIFLGVTERKFPKELHLGLQGTKRPFFAVQRNVGSFFKHEALHRLNMRRDT